MTKRVIIRALQLFFLLVVLFASALGIYVWRTWDRSYDEYPVPQVHATQRSWGDRSGRVSRVRTSALRRMSCELLPGVSKDRRWSEGATARRHQVRGAAARRGLLAEPGRLPFHRHERRGHDRHHLVSQGAASGAQPGATKTNGRYPARSSAAFRRHSSPAIAVRCARQRSRLRKR